MARPYWAAAHPEEARATLGKAIVDIVKQPDIQDKFRAIGFEPTGLGVTEFSAFHDAEVKVRRS